MMELAVSYVTENFYNENTYQWTGARKTNSKWIQTCRKGMEANQAYTSWFFAGILLFKFGRKQYFLVDFHINVHVREYFLYNYLTSYSQVNFSTLLIINFQVHFSQCLCCREEILFATPSWHITYIFQCDFFCLILHEWRQVYVTNSLCYEAVASKAKYVCINRFNFSEIFSHSTRVVHAPTVPNPLGTFLVGLTSRVPGTWMSAAGQYYWMLRGPGGSSSYKPMRLL